MIGTALIPPSFEHQIASQYDLDALQILRDTLARTQ
jgi:hypothetical protein